jgi:hypothetical protein
MKDSIAFPELRIVGYDGKTRAFRTCRRCGSLFYILKAEEALPFHDLCADCIPEGPRGCVYR